MKWFGGLEKLKKNEKIKCNGMVEMDGANKWLQAKLSTMK